MKNKKSVMKKMAGNFLAGVCAALGVLGALAWAAPVSAEPVVISLEDCLAVAEANHPSLAGADGQITSQRGRLAQSAASDRPEVSGSVSTSRSGSGGEESARYSADVTASVKVFDANRNKYSVEAQRSTLLAAEEDKRSTLRDIRAGVKSAYMTILLDAEIEKHRYESVQAFERYLEQAKALYETGLQPWYNVTKAEVDLGKAQLALVEAESDVEIAKVSLFNAMGVEMPEEEYDLAPIEFEVPEPLPEENELLSEALGNRSDYRASELKVLAGRSTIKTEARASSPSVSVSAGTGAGGMDAFDLESEWNLGLGMSIPIIDGGAAKARVDTAKGQLTSLEASREKLRQDIVLEVRKTLADIEKARERIRISELNVTSAEENRKIAMGRYETGVGDPFEVTDALLSYTEAQLENRQAMYDMQLALVALEQSIGK